MARGPNGKSGWLGFLIFQLVATPLFYLGREAGPIYELEREGLKFPDGFKFMYFGSIVVTGALLFYAGYLLWSGKTRQDALDALKFMTKGPSPEGGGFSAAGDNGTAVIADKIVFSFNSVYGVAPPSIGWYSSFHGAVADTAGWAHVVKI